MSVMVTELYRALRDAHVSEEVAVKAAEAVVPRSEAATRADLADLRVLIEGLRGDLRADIQKAKNDLIIWAVGSGIALTGLFAWIVNALVRR